MILKQILNNKEYPLVEFRCIYKDQNNENVDVFIGYCSYLNKNLIPLDGDIYSLDDEYIKHAEFTLSKDTSIDNTIYKKGSTCITVWEKGGRL